MSRHFSTAEQISVLSDEQIDALLVEMEAGRETQVEPDGVKRLIGKGIIRGAAAFGEGALLGFQGRPLSEGTFTGDKPKAATDTYGELLKREQLKNIVDPSRIKAQQDIENERLKKEVREKKRLEQNGEIDVTRQKIGKSTMGGEIPTKQITKGVDEFGDPIIENIIDPEYEKDLAIRKAAEIENQKPYSADEIRIASKADLVPAIDKLITLLEEKDVYESNISKGSVRLPLGASRISAFGTKSEGFISNVSDSLKKALTAGEGREAGLLLQDIKTLMFGEGGSALTDTETSILAGLLNPAYKEEGRWIVDLREAKRRIQNRVRMLRTNPQEATQESLGIKQKTQPSGQQNNVNEKDFSNLW